MIQSKPHAPATDRMPLHSGGGCVLILEAPFYAGITQALVDGATGVLEDHGVGFERVAVPGALELPQALMQAVLAGHFSGAGERRKYLGAVALGCIIRGETSHYDIVCNNTNHWLMEVAVSRGIPLGNGVLTVDTEAQAVARSDGGRSGKGGDAARACLRLMALAGEPGKAAQ